MRYVWCYRMAKSEHGGVWSVHTSVSVFLLSVLRRPNVVVTQMKALDSF
ncbi:hypothetical protein SP21_67 [Salmonella phage 21]|nr:hypothetical protein SP21_67 [Salmonella phage 21]